MNSVITISALSDNFIYLYKYDKNNTIVIDPCDSAPVQHVLQERGLDLTTILATHHHWDHVGGIEELKKRYGCKVIGSDKKRIPGLDTLVAANQEISIAGTKIKVIATPGHTRTSVCYFKTPSDNQKPLVWTGDTLFISGCGRVFECDMKTMWLSLNKLTDLPDETVVYCGHDYTRENCEFALSVEPENVQIKERLKEIKQLQSKGYDIQSTIGEEKIFNPFLRSDNAKAFEKLRKQKDLF